MTNTNNCKEWFDIFLATNWDKKEKQVKNEFDKIYQELEKEAKTKLKG